MQRLIKFFEEWDEERFGVDEPFRINITVDEDTVKRIKKVQRHAEEKARRRSAKRIIKSDKYFDEKHYRYARRHI